MSSTITNSAMIKIAAVVAGLAMFASFAFVAPANAASLTNSQVQSILSLLSSFGASSATVANVQAALTGSTPVSTGGSTVSSSCNFTMSLTMGNKGSDVTCLQTALINAGYTIPAGATGYFGNQTRSAVAAWQKANSIAPAVGYFGPISRAHWNLGGTTTTGGTTTGGTTGGTTVTGNGLQVSLAAGSPSGTVIVQKQGIAKLGEFTFSNPTSAAINVTNLTFNRIGVSNDSTLTNVYLYNGVTPITDSAGITNSQFSYNNSAGVFTVPAGGSYTVTVRSDIADSTSGQQIGVQLTSVGSNGTLDSSVSFPIVGGLQTISAASLATVDFNTTGSPLLTLPSANSSLSPTADYTVWQDTVSVSVNPVKLTSMHFTNLGSINANDIQNLRLYVDGTQVGSAVSQLSANRTVTFDLSASPVLLSTSSHIIKVVANVVGGSSRTFQLSLQRTSSSMFVDSQLNQPVVPTINGGLNFAAVTSGLQTVASVATSGVSVTKAAASPINDIPVGATNVKLASFNFLVTGEAVKISNLIVASSNSGGLKNGKIMVNGVQVGSTKDILAAGQTFSLGSSLIIPANKVTVVDIYADAKTTAGVNLANAATTQITLNVGASNGQGQSSLNSVNVPTASQSGNSITVSSTGLTATAFSGYGDQTMIPGTQNARLGSFTLSAGATQGVNVNTIALSFPSAAIAGYVQNLTLKDNATGTQIGSIITTPGATGNTFSTNFVIPAAGTKTIDIYGNILSNTPTSSTITSSLVSANGTGTVTSSDASTPSGALALQSIAVNSGTLVMALGASNPVSANVIAGSNNVPVADYTFTAANSSYTVQKLQVTTTESSVHATGGLTLQYKNAAGTVVTTEQAVAGGTATFSNLSFYVPANGSADIQILTSVPTIANGATSGTHFAVTLAATGFQAINSAGNPLTTISGSVISGTITSGYGVVVIHKSLPTFAGQSHTTTAMPNSGTDLYKFTVSADAAGAVDLKTVSFNVATSTGGQSLTNFNLYDVTSGGSPVLLGTAVKADANGIVSITSTNVIQIGASQSKTFTLRAANYTGTWGTHNSITVHLASADSTWVTNAASVITGVNYTWSDRSATNPWTNGYLLKDVIDGTYSFSN